MYYIIMTGTCHYAFVQTHRVYDDETQPLCTGAKLNSGYRILGKVEKNSFIVLPGKEGHRGLMLSKLCVPTWRGFGEKF